MAELVPVPFDLLVTRALEEHERCGSVFDLPARSFFRPDPGLDLGVTFQGRPAATPVGPASGPHTQLAQNLVLSWLGGGRVLELKTVQVNDRLTLPRPCIHAPNLGFNVEWSQELRIEESLREYVAGSMLIEILTAAGVAGRPGEPVQLDLSLGYDLAGIRSDRVRRFVEGMKDARGTVEELRRLVPERFARFRDLPFRTDLAHNVTLSTFHGCPPDEIEGIVRFLLTEMDLDVVVKMNPTLIGRERAEWLMYDVLGYGSLPMNSLAFARDLDFPAAAAMVERLGETARARGRRLGVKMSNTLEVLNPGGPFREAVVYVSGAPLHVLALHGVELWRSRFGADLPISFSAGADAQNFPGLVAIGLVPVTVCTDLLRPGGYARLPKYLTRLEAALRERGVRNVPDWVVRAGGHAAGAVADAVAEVRRRSEAGAGEWPEGARAIAERALDEAAQRLNADCAAPRCDLQAVIDAAVAGARGALSRWGRDPGVQGFLADLAGLRLRARDLAAVRASAELVAATRVDPRYRQAHNQAVPRRLSTRLVLFDCIACDKCVPVCPNDAIFRFTVPAVAAARVTLTVTGGEAVAGPPGEFRLERGHQLACYADACNECGNCETFCPETGGPQVRKPRLFGSRASWERWRALDGFVIEKGTQCWGMHGRIQGREYRLTVPLAGGRARFGDDRIWCELEGRDGLPTRAEVAPGTPDGHTLDLGWYCAMRAILDGMGNSDEVNFVNAHWR